MPQISQITLPSGSVYDLKDAYARSAIEAIVGGDAVVFVGVSSTPLTDGGSQSPTVDGQTLVPAAGQLFFYGTEEFIWGPDSKWHALGSLDSLGALAYKDSASASYKPKGTVSQPTFTGSSSNVTITATDSTSGNYQPKGTVSQPTFTGTQFMSTGTFTPSGDVSVSIATNTNKTALVSAAEQGAVTYTPAGTVSQPTFSGTSFNSTGTFTPAGSVGLTTSNKTAAVSKASSGTVTYTPQGSVAAPTISVATAGSTTTIKNPTSETVAKTVVAVAPGATAPANAITYYSVNNENLSFYQLGYTTGASITTSNVTVKNGDASYEASAPAFTGTGVRLVTGNIAVPTSASFTGTEGNVTVSGTATGSVSQPTFTGTGARLVTENIQVPATFSATFTGTPDDVDVSGIPTGTVSQPTFTGTKAQLSGTTTAAGTVSQPTFEGTQETIEVT